MTTQAKMRSIDPVVDDFAEIDVRLTPGKISMISLIGVASPWRIDRHG
jgi:hypothetical protein